MSRSNAAVIPQLPEASPSIKDGTLGTSLTCVKITSGKSFTVHTDLLRYWSPKMCLTLRNESTELNVEANDEVCSAFIGWLYMQHLPPLNNYRHDDVEPWDNDIEIEEIEELEDFERFYRTSHGSHALDVYIFATRYDIRQLKNDAIDAMVKNRTCILFYYSIVIKAFDMHSRGSPFLEFLVAAYARYYKIGTDNERPELVLRQRLPNSFLVSLLLKKMEGECKEEDPLNMCDYHEHVGTERENCKAHIRFLRLQWAEQDEDSGSETVNSRRQPVLSQAAGSERGPKRMIPKAEGNGSGSLKDGWLVGWRFTGHISQLCARHGADPTFDGRLLRSGY